MTPHHPSALGDRTTLVLNKITLQTVPRDSISLSETIGVLNQFNIINHYLMHRAMQTSVTLYRTIDSGLLQIVGPLGLQRLTVFLSFIIESFSTGFILHYALLILGT
jgi:hypothetical protein